MTAFYIRIEYKIASFARYKGVFTLRKQKYHRITTVYLLNNRYYDLCQEKCDIGDE